VTKGGRAALAAIEALESDTGTETPITKANATGNAGLHYVKKADELIPPRGIVNSAQLEMELVRMFANAVMFNPLPTRERAFGRSLRLRRDEAKLKAEQDEEGSSEDEEEDEEESSVSPGLDEGIISDAREMFEDVIEQLGKWRELEVERLGSLGGEDKGAVFAAVGPRQSSVSVSVSSAVEEGDVVEKEEREEKEKEREQTTSAVGGRRKRRKIAE